MKKQQIINRLSSIHAEDLYIKRILKRAVRRLRSNGIRYIIRNHKEIQNNIELL